MKTTQFSIGLMIVIFAVVGLLFYRYYERDKIAFLASSIFLLFCLLFFYKLDVSVNTHSLQLKFGIGVIRKNILLSDIDSVKVVRNSPLIGWGIRYHSDYTLYNVHGLSAIEISLKNDRRNVRIGCENPEALREYIVQQINQIN